MLNLELQLSYHKFNESERETTILKRLQHGDIVALISDAGTPCVSDPGFELVCDSFNNFLVISILTKRNCLLIRDSLNDALCIWFEVILIKKN